VAEKAPLLKILCFASGNCCNIESVRELTPEALPASTQDSSIKYFPQIFSAYVLAYAFFFCSRPLNDPDFWFHLKTGELIFTSGSIPKTDPFSFTNFGKAWVAHEWLSGAIFYAVYSRLGFAVLILLFSIVATLAFWLVFKRSSTHPFLKGFALLLSVWVVVPTVGVRPRVFTMLLTGLYLSLLFDFARGGNKRRIWWLVPLMAVWANLHAGFLMGLVVIGLVGVGIVLDAWSEGARFSLLYPRLLTLGLVLAGCLLVVMLNPHGARIYTFPFEIFSSPVQQELVSDWLSPDFHESWLFPLLLLILLTFVMLALSPKRPKPSELLLFTATLYATLKSTRHMAIFALVAGPMLAEYSQAWLASTTFGRAFGRQPSIKMNALVLVTGLVLLLPLVAFSVKLSSMLVNPVRQEVVGVPVNAVNELKAKQITGNTFTDPNIWGDYLIWAAPANPVYIDGRIDMYGDQFVREYLNVIWGLSDWRAPFDRYGVKVAIVRIKSPLRRELKAAPDWQLISEDDMAAVFARK
jgi:hypothetical protein